MDKTEEEYEEDMCDLLEKAAKEQPINQQMGGKPKVKHLYYKPHNLRLYFDFDRKTLTLSSKKSSYIKPIAKFKNHSQGGMVEHRIINSTEIIIDNFFGFSLRVKKTQIEMILKSKKVYRQPITTKTSATMEKLRQDVIMDAQSVLRTFMRKYGGNSELTLLKQHSEEKFWDEEAINKIPKRYKWHTPNTKKVYNQKNVEFKGIAAAANYMENRAIESIAPDIKSEFDEMKQMQLSTASMVHDLAKLQTNQAQTTLPILKDLTLNIKIHNRALKGLDKGVAKLNKLLESKQKKLGDYV